MRRRTFHKISNDVEIRNYNRSPHGLNNETNHKRIVNYQLNVRPTRKIVCFYAHKTQ